MDDPTPDASSTRRRNLVLVMVAFVVVLGGAAFVLLAADDDPDEATKGSTTTAVSTTDVSITATTSPTTSAGSSTSATATTTPTTGAPGAGTAVFPSGDGPTFTDPVEVATAFATDYVGFAAPVVGEFRSGDSRSGEVEVRPTADGPVTTVLVRQLGSGDEWSVIGAATDAIRLTSPAAGAVISAPVRLQGTSTAFEATVNVEVREAGSSDALGEGYVMGGSMGEMGPFDGSVPFAQPTATSGAIMLFTQSMENGQVWEATVVAVSFGP